MSQSGKKIRAFFADDGPLASAFSAYEVRQPQVDMALAVGDALENERRVVVEAATGTGKTLAYLVPALLLEKKVMVSTATKALQEQLFYKDVPFLASLGLDIKPAYLKGRSNYLCKLKLQEFEISPMFRRKGELELFRQILKWSRKTQTGDRAELRQLPDDYATWADISTSSDACLGQKCPQFEACFVTRVRRAARDANVLIVNHHLFFADLSVRATSDGEVLPKTDAVIFDEAHHLESSATSFFGRTVSIFRWRRLSEDISRATSSSLKVNDPLLTALDAVDKSIGLLLANTLKCLKGKDRRELSEHLTDDPEIAEPLAATETALTVFGRSVTHRASLGETAATLGRRVGELHSDLGFIYRRQDPAWVYFSEVRGRVPTPFLQACPIDLGAVFQQLMYPSHRTTIFTSATLAVGGKFDYFRARIALPHDDTTATIQLGSTFDYMRQALLFVPEDVPEPSDPGYIDAITPVIEQLLHITEGRAFVLFTSYRNMHAVHERLADELPYRLLVQGQGAKSALLDDFRAEPSVLFATSSFWEGVDVPGEHLSLVVIDKLPFASPTDPIVKARIGFVGAQGGNAFKHYQLPEAAISLKQGFGRLIRKREDRGIVAILDPRLVNRPYGRLFLSSLPRARRTRRLSQVERWWAVVTGAKGGGEADG